MKTYLIYDSWTWVVFLPPKAGIWGGFTRKEDSNCWKPYHPWGWYDLLTFTQEIQRPNGLPIGRIGDPLQSMDHPKDQPLCLVLDFQGLPSKSTKFSKYMVNIEYMDGMG